MFGIYARNIISGQGRYIPDAEDRAKKMEAAFKSENDAEPFYELLKNSANRQKIIDEAQKRFPNKPRFEIEQAYERGYAAIIKEQ